MDKTTRIFLVGFMGSGKSTLGKKLANKLKLQFLDLDQLIEKQEYCTVTEIFKNKGEDYFRALETAVLKDLVQTNTDFVLSLGGGTPCFNNNMEFINSIGTSIYLKYNAGILTSRLLAAKQERPLIAGKNAEELKQFVDDLLTQRESFYLQSKFIVEGATISVNEILNKLN